MIKYTNKYGKVGIETSVVAAIAADTAAGFGSAVQFTNSKGRPVKESAAGFDKFNFINVAEDKKKGLISVEIFVMLRFGTSIGGFTEEYARRLRSETEKITGVTIDSVVINITGIKSKRTVKRELRIVC